MVFSYRNLACAAVSRAAAFDPHFPCTDAMTTLWAEALQRAGITTAQDVLMAVRVMYRNHDPEPGWRPSARLLVATAQECRRLRLEREAAAAERRGKFSTR